MSFAALLSGGSKAAKRAFGGSNRTFNGGMFNIKATGSIGERTEKFEKHFWPKLEKFLKENAVGLAYDLANASMPATKGNSISESYDKFIKNHELWTRAAFKTPKDRPIKYWIVENDVQSIKAYILQTKFSFSVPFLDRALKAGQYAWLKEFFSASMRASGEIMPKKPKVYDNASLELLYKYKMAYLKGKKDDKLFIRNPKSIERVMNDKSIHNRVALMAGGWQKVARDLGGKADAATKPFNQIWANDKGKGKGTVKVVDKTPKSVVVTARNEYGNIFGWYERKESQDAVIKRKKHMEAAFKTFIQQNKP